MDLDDGEGFQQEPQIHQPPQNSASSSGFLPNSHSSVPEMLHAAQCWLEDIDDNPNRVPPAFATAKKPVKAMCWDGPS
jgi:hypothetical protein